MFSNVAYNVCDQADLVCDTSNLLQVESIQGYRNLAKLGGEVHGGYCAKPTKLHPIGRCENAVIWLVKQ